MAAVQPPAGFDPPSGKPSGDKKEVEKRFDAVIETTKQAKVKVVEKKMELNASDHLKN